MSLLHNLCRFQAQLRRTTLEYVTNMSHLVTSAVFVNFEVVAGTVQYSPLLLNSTAISVICNFLNMHSMRHRKLQRSRLQCNTRELSLSKYVLQ